MTEQELKLAFAEEWLKTPKDAFAAALRATRNNHFTAIQITDNWLWDDEVLAFKEQLIKERGEEAFLPSTAEMVHTILDKANTTSDLDHFTKMYRLIADIRGMIQKPGVTITNTHTTNKVMVVPVITGADGKLVDSYGWEQQLMNQQESLVNK